MKSRRRVLLAALSASIVTALVVGGIGWASIPDENDEIHGCYAKKDGVLRIIDSATTNCNPAKENSLTWGQVGPKGDPGDKGDPGAQGPSGISQAYHALGSQFDLTTATDQVVVAKSVPEGNYVLLVQIYARAVSLTAGVHCQLERNIDANTKIVFAGLDAADVSTSTETFTMQSFRSAAATDLSFSVSCHATGLNAQILGTEFIAVAVDAVS